MINTKLNIAIRGDRFEISFADSRDTLVTCDNTSITTLLGNSRDKALAIQKILYRYSESGKTAIQIQQDFWYSAVEILSDNISGSAMYMDSDETLTLNLTNVQFSEYESSMQSLKALIDEVIAV